MTVTTDPAVKVDVPAPTSYAANFLRDDLTWAAAGGGFPADPVIDIDVGGQLVFDIDVAPPSLVTGS